jgi:lipopolysaccharide/colanic/teichoic acid biosynthesis glycosyltransferase
MNNFEMSIFPSSGEDSVTPPASDRHVLWVDTLKGATHLKHPSTHDRNLIERSTEDSRAKAVQVDDLVKKVGLLPHFQKDECDFGMWLLHRSDVRLGGWAGIGTKARVGVGGHARDVLKLCPGLTKRCCDVVGSLMLLIALWPLLAVIAVLIKLDSGGPILFRHERIGKNGSQFVLLKFRSMKVDVPKYECSPTSGLDMRLTRLGRIIRRLSLDEIPQLINVLKGDMSLVGPRPEMPFIVEGYGVLERERLTVKPGITGLWQISPARAFPIHENLQYDLYYVRNRNLVLDCAILVRTITAVIRGVGAI